MRSESSTTTCVNSARNSQTNSATASSWAEPTTTKQPAVGRNLPRPNSQQLDGTYHDQTASSWTAPTTIEQRQRSRQRSPATLCGSGSRVPARPQPENVERALDNDLREQRQKQSDQFSISQQLDGTYHDQTASSWTEPTTTKQPAVGKKPTTTKQPAVGRHLPRSNSASAADSARRQRSAAAARGCRLGHSPRMRSESSTTTFVNSARNSQTNSASASSWTESTTTKQPAVGRNLPRPNSQQLDGTYHDQTAISWTEPTTIKQRQRSRQRSPATLCGSGSRVPARPQPENVERELDHDLRE